MKNKLSKSLLLFLIPFTLIITSCNKDGTSSNSDTSKDDTSITTVHTHTYDKEVTTDTYLANAATCTAKATYYYSCECGEKGSETFEYGELAAHTPGNWITDTEATHMAKGSKHQVCSVCGATIDTAEIDKTTEHTFDQEVTTSDYLATEVTCTAKATYYYSCECGEKGTQTFEYGELAAHTESDWIVDTAATHMKEGSKHKECTVCHTTLETETIDKTTEHTFDKQVTTSDYLASAATCTAKATYYYSCECGEKGTETFESGEPNGHNYGEVTYNWDTAGHVWCQASRNCSVCNDYQTANTTNITASKDTATCTAGGEIVYTATFSEEWAGTTTDTVSTSEKGHSYGEVKYNWDTVNYLYCQATRTCNDCGNKELALAVSGYGTITATEDTATCTEAGQIIYTATFTEEWAETQTKKVPTSAKGHTAETVTGKAATCTETGLTDGSKCSVCGETLTAQEVIDALGHKWGTTTYKWADDYSSCTATRVCENDSTHIETLTSASVNSTTDTATCTAGGSIVYTPFFEVTDEESWVNNVPLEVETKAKGHTWTDANCTTPKTCSVCQTTEGEKDPNNHSGTLTWVTTETTHKKAYSCCNTVTVEEENHSLIYNYSNYKHYQVCEECGYESEKTDHTYSTYYTDTDGTTYQKCDVCGFTQESYQMAYYSYGDSSTDTSLSLTKVMPYAYTVTIPNEYASSSTSEAIPVTGIDSKAGKDCTRLVSVSIPDSVTTIGDSVFSGCTALTTVILGKGVTSIGENAFSGCTAGLKIYYRGTATEWNNITKNDTSSEFTSATVYYYSESQPTDTTYTYWHYVNNTPTVWSTGA